MAKLPIYIDLSTMSNNELEDMVNAITTELRTREGPTPQEIQMIYYFVDQKSAGRDNNWYIQAIKAFRNRTHCSLSEAVDILRPIRDRLMKNLA